VELFDQFSFGHFFFSQIYEVGPPGPLTKFASHTGVSATPWA